MTENNPNVKKTPMHYTNLMHKNMEKNLKCP
jgi:hypothetical protein